MAGSSVVGTEGGAKLNLNQMMKCLIGSFKKLRLDNNKTPLKGIKQG